MAIKEINDLSEIAKNDWLIMFYSTWCGPCLKMDYLEELSSEINVGIINIEENKKLAESNSIIIVPTYILYINGKKYKKIIGLKNKEFLKTLIKGKT